MTTYQQLRRIAAGMVCLTVIPAAAMAGDYLEGKTYNRDPSEPRPLTPSEQQWQPPYDGGDPTRAQKVEERTQHYMREAFGTGETHEHDERDHMTPQAISGIVARAQSGDADAMGQMGYNYQYGLGVEKNEKLAVEWYKRAVEYGGNEYYSAIGDLYRDYSTGQEKGFFSGIRSMISGEDKNAVQKDNAIALEWYRKGLEHDDWRAYAGLGELYRDGVGGVQKDLGIANSYYNRGMALKKQRDEREIMEVKRQIRARAEQEIPINPSAVPEQDASAADSAENLPTIILGGERCVYSPSRLTRKGYSSVFDVRCPNLRNKQLTVEKASLPGLQCEIERIGGGSSLLLLCNVAEEQGIRIGSANCSLRTEKKRPDYAAVYGAYCNKAAETDIGQVSYLGMTCDVEPAAAGQGKTYTLKCGSTAQEGAAGGQAKTTMTQRIGQYNCSLREMDSPSQAYRASYEAYCGGLGEADKNARSVPGSISLGVSLCDVEPWPANDQGKDFELYCR